MPDVDGFLRCLSPRRSRGRNFTHVESGPGLRRDDERRATKAASGFLGNDGATWLRVCILLTAFLFQAAHAKDAAPEATNPLLEARMVRITSELRCLVCQNQTIADSHADLAVDLRRQVREQLQAGRSDDEIVDYMTARYGDFVLYRPPFKATTAFLWIGPALMLVVGGVALVIVLRRRRRLPDDAFDIDDDGDRIEHRDIGHA